MKTAKKSKRKTAKTSPKRNLRLVHGGTSHASQSTMLAGGMRTQSDSMGLYAIATVAFIFGLEFFLRLTPLMPFIGEPTKSLLDESMRGQMTNVRTIGTNASILLPRYSKADAIAVGDAYTFGPQMRATDTFPNQLGQMMNWNVANLGITGSGLAENNRMLEVGYRFQPQLALYTISPENFVNPGTERIRNLSMERAFQSSDSDRRFFVSSTSDLNWMENLTAIRTNLFSLFVTPSVLKGLFSPPTPRQNLIRIGNRFLSLRDRAYSENRLSYTNPTVQFGLEKLTEHLKMATQFGNQMGFKTIVVLLPSKEMVYGQLTNSPSQFTSEDFHRTYFEFSKLLNHNQIAVIDMTEDFRRMAAAGKWLYFTYAPYLNSDGHRAVADTIARFLQNNSNFLMERRSPL